MIAKRNIEQLENEYNPGRDLILDTPTVTWADYTLLELVKDLYEEIEQLKKQVAEMNAALEGVYFRNN